MGLSLLVPVVEFASSVLVTVANETLYQLSYDPNQFRHDSSNDRYYAVFRVKGKLIWKSLKTSDREFAKRKL